MRALLLTLAAVALAAEPPKYTGPGSCASPSCHGGVQPRSETSVMQNEYSTWVVKDKHAQAYTVLSNPIAMRMAKILSIDNPGAAPKCLACHALDVPVEVRARTFDPADGVGCENCHGPASNWLGPHTTRGWTHQQSIDAGMYDLRDPIHRSEKCLSCHLGAKEKFVDHEMIAAGHPDLYFELASFSAVMPRHWKQPWDKDPKDSSNKDPWLDVRGLAVGMAVQLREQLSKIAREAQSGTWPEFAEFECFACHHNLTSAKDSWRQQLGYGEQRPGNPIWNVSRYAVMQQVLSEIDRPAAVRLTDEVGDLFKLVSTLAWDRARIASHAASAAGSADRVAQKMAAAQFDGPRTQRLLRNISGDSEIISAQGERAAEQAAMVLDALFAAYSRNTKVANADQVRAAIQALFRQFDDPSSYNPNKFAQQMRVVNDLLK